MEGFAQIPEVATRAAAKRVALDITVMRLTTDISRAAKSPDLSGDLPEI